MRRLFPITALLICLNFQSFGQVKIGLKAGGNYSNTRFHNFDQFKKSEFKPGFHAGIFLVLVTGKDFSIKQEFLYNVKGWKNSDSLETNKVHLHYLIQSILFYQKLTPKFYLLFGPEVGYLLIMSPKHTGPSIPEMDHLDESAFNRLEASFIAGISYQMLEQLTLEARYTKGLTSVLDWRLQRAPYHYTGGNNKMVQVSLGYTFKKKAQKT